MPRVSVLIPTYGQAAFVRRALDSLVRQTMTDWEARIVLDGAIDETLALVQAFMSDSRIQTRLLARNAGLGAALNLALDDALAPTIAYLPTDDVWYADHLATALAALDAEPGAVLAFAGLRHHATRTSLDPIADGLQLVQVVHRRTEDRWVERGEVVTDDLERMYWGALRPRGRFVPTGRVTCEWVDHPLQRTKIVREPVGGVNRYRLRYRVDHPMRFESTVGDAIDEVERYRRFRERPDTPRAPDGLRILLVGELSRNPERILALEERGHELHGLWTPDAHGSNAVGPQPFGHVAEAPSRDPRAAIEAVRPDLIYALLNWQAVRFAAAVQRANPGVPFVWHFKDGPFTCLEQGCWDDLVQLASGSNGVIHSSAEMRDWFEAVLPDAVPHDRTLVLDGDLPKREWFDGPVSPRLPHRGGETHTVVPGRPIGLEPEQVAELAGERIHLHLCGDYSHGPWRAWTARAAALAPRHLHLHPAVDPRDWVEAFSRYDAGWLPLFDSTNAGDIHAARWDDLNLPAEMAMLAAAGLPMLQRDNTGSIVAAHALARRLRVGIEFRTAEELATKLRAEVSDRAIGARVADVREAFAFDTHAERLLAFFRRVVGGGARRSGAQWAADGRRPRATKMQQAPVSAFDPGRRRTP